MQRVVCPVCKTGFEAAISRSNFAINCVQCGVAFNASAFLSKSEQPPPAPRYVGPVLVNPPQADTQTGGLPFVDPVEEFGSVATVETPPVLDKRRAPAGGTPLPVLTRNNIVAGAASGGRGSVLIVRNSPAVPPAQEPSVVAAAMPAPAAKRYFGPVINLETAPKSARADEPVPSIGSKPAEKPAPKAAIQASEPVPVAAPVRPKKGRRQLLEGAFGKYDIEGEIARGGVGAVFKVRERESGKHFALKILIEGDEVGETERERFRHECETAKALSLPGMVQIHEVGEQDGRPFMVMELVEGKSLDKVIAERSLSVNDCLVLMKSVAATVGALHEAGYVHRDIKPGNILLDAFGTPKVADFGLVKSLDEITRMTASGLVCGTPAYMSPEQARGDGTAVDPRSDVWALGAVLYEMLAGEPPFKADNALRLMLRITKEAPRKLRIVNQKVPRDVEAMVMKCLDKAALRRYANGKALAADLSTFLEGGELNLRTRPKMRKWLDSAIRQRGTLMPIGAAAAALLIVGLVYHVASQPVDANVYVERGFQALADTSKTPAEKLVLAQNAFNQAVALDWKNGRAYLGLARCEAQRGIDPVTHAVLDPNLVKLAFRNNERAAQLDPKLQVEALLNAARYNMWLRDHVTESACMERAVKLEPTNLKYRESLGLAYWNAGALQGSVRYYRSALTVFQSILAQRPDYPKVNDYIRQIQDKFLPGQGRTAISMQ